MVGTVPEDKKPPQAVLQEGLETLQLRLLDVARDVVMSWLGPDVIAQVLARWEIERAGIADEQALLDLADDTSLALSRIAAACAEMQAAEARVTETKRASEVLESELATRTSAIRKLELAERGLQAREDSITAERKRTDVMLFVLASASPRGEVFDPAVDYAAQADQPSAGEPIAEDNSGQPAIESSANAVEVAAPETPARSAEASILDDVESAPALVSEPSVGVAEALVPEPVAASPMLVPKPAVDAPRAAVAEPPPEPTALRALPAPVGVGAASTPRERAEDLRDPLPVAECVFQPIVDGISG